MVMDVHCIWVKKKHRLDGVLKFFSRCRRREHVTLTTEWGLAMSMGRCEEDGKFLVLLFFFILNGNSKCAL
ncbi:hypothetical protein L484_022315 [Morus notabilis]|uniref:Uncharacterized protein n=1 Tax=Morus notabilis TaxID=981085 RepID=W9QJB3_9ROSA|nr:hypothetical protein L484_022315 [Morus notabilis]